MRERLLHHADLFRKLRQLLVLSTLFSLPLTALGATETVTRTITFNEVVSANSPYVQNSTLPVSITDVVGGSSTNASGAVKILDDLNVIDSYTGNAYGTVFTLNNDENTTASKYFTIEIPGTYPAVPSQVTLKVAYANSGTDENKIQVGDYGNGQQDANVPQSGELVTNFYHYYHPYRSHETSLTETTLTYTGNNQSGLGTNRDEAKPLYICVYLNKNATFTIKEATITYDREDYGITVAGTPVKSDNVSNILADGANNGKVTFTPAAAVNDPNVLTLNGANIEIHTTEAIKSTMTTPLYVNIVGESTISCNGHSAFDIAENLVFQTSGTAPGTLTITNTSGVTTSTFYSIPNNGTPTYENSLVATQSTPNIVVISVPTSYNLTVGGVAVTSVNAGSITGANITGNVSFDNATNTLTLKNATITGDYGIVYGGDLNLNIAINGTNSVTKSYGTYGILANGNGSLVFVKDANANSAELTIIAGDGATDPVNAANPTLGSGLYWKPTAQNIMVITEDPNFVIIDNLIMTDSRTVDGTTGSITYNSTDKILTLNGYTKDFGTQHAIKTGVSGLKVKLIGANTINCSADSAVFHAFSSSASIQFIKNDATSKLTMTGTAFNNFAANNITYDGLFYYSDDPNKYITQAAAPKITKSVDYDNGLPYTYAKIDYADSDKSGGNALYAAANPVLKYSFDYADPQKQDVSDQAYSAYGIKMTDPGVLTTWVEVGSYKGPESKGVRFGFLENPIEMEFDGTAKQISITPAPTMTNAVTYSVRSDSQSKFDGFAVLDATNNKITINSCYEGKIGFSFSNTDGGYTSLNDSTDITFNVLPSKPTLSLGSGVYYPGQQITATPTVPDGDYNSYFDINNNHEAGYTQPYTYTFNSAGVFNVSSMSYYVRGGNLAPLFGESVEAKIIINDKPAFTATVGANAYDETNPQTGDVTIAISANLQTDCKLMYYYGSDKSKAVEYDNTNPIVLHETTTLNAFIRYTSTSGPTVTYDSEPITKSYTVKQEASITFANGQSYMTYYEPNFSLTKPAGLKVYTITGVSGSSVTTSALDYIPQGVAVLLEKDGEKPAGGYVAETYTGTQGSFASNKLKYANTDVAATDDTYILYKNEFLKATGTIPNQHCYLDLSGVAPSRGMYGIGDGSTAIDATLMDHEGMNKEEWYDLQGRRIQKPTKPGLYIVNGKKVIINNK